MTDTNLIELNGVKVKRGKFLLQIPEWRVPAGSVVGVIGPNGAGKTTLLRLLPGLDPWDSGDVRVLGADPLVDPSFVRSNLGYMSDDMPVFNLRVGKLLWFISGYYPSWDPKLADELVRLFALDLTQSSVTLSKGQATKLRILLALAFHPRVVVLDEPATGLDLWARRELLELVRDVVRDPERSVIISSHEIAELERIADRLLVLDQGRVTHEGSTDTLVGSGRTLEEAFLAWGRS